ncbi:histidine phosphatase superfamily [Syncephalis plumigaleata]|nr:histidine phosphatase superfamily [Syncephalis plumigaleata]
MARLCINDYVTYNRTNQWCELLEAFPSELDDVDSEEVPYDDAPGAYGPDPNIMELSDYVGDVLTYRRVGAGHRDNRCYGTMAMYELVSNMRRAILGQLKRPWQLGFTQHYTIIMLLTFMGLYDETPTFNRHRLFRMSQLIPFAANLHFEVLACVDEEEADEEDPGYFVRVLLNERPIQIPGCPGDGPLCPWSKFYSVMQRNLSKCDFEEICSH